MGAAPAAGAGAARLIWDNEPGIGRGRRRAEGVAAFTGTLATTLVRLPPRDPESKGIVERRNRFFETSFMPGRDFAVSGGLQRPARRLAGAGERPGGAHDQGPPVDLLDADGPRCCRCRRCPLQLGWRNRVRLGRDYYVRLDTNDYSVDPAMIGRLVDVTADLERVRVRVDGRLVAEHCRVWARGTTVTDPAHVEPPPGCCGSSSESRRHRAAHDDLVRDLADYDRAFGLAGDDGQVA